MLFILLLATLIIVNAYFSAVEIAFISVEQYRLQEAADHGNLRARQLLQLLQDPDYYLSSIQVGITLVGIIEGFYGGELLQQYLEPRFLAWGLLPWLSHVLSLAIGVGGITYLSIVLGELLPKSIALSFPQKVSMAILPSFRIFTLLISPFVRLLTISTRFLLKRFHLKGPEDKTLSDEDLKGFLSLAYRKGALAKTELELHENIFRFYDETIGKVMTPASRVVSIRNTHSREEAAKLLRSSTHMFYPVLNEKEQVLGYLSAKEFFMEPNKTIQQLTLPACFISEEQTMPELLEQFKRYRYNFGIAVNRLGQFTGVVTIHDVGTLLIGDFS